MNSSIINMLILKTRYEDLVLVLLSNSRGDIKYMIKYRDLEFKEKVCYGNRGCESQVLST